jgi:uncharacterized protein
MVEITHTGCGGMRLIKNLMIPTRHGCVAADVFLPDEPAQGDGAWPAILSMSPYGKDRHFSELDPTTYAKLPDHHAYQVYEAPDPVTWTGFGYAMVRIDSPGTGASPGHIDVFSRRDDECYFDAIEYVAALPWCTGRVGLLGISYYSRSQIAVAALRPPHLACIVPWEVGGDSYAPTHQEGIHNSFFLASWWAGFVLPNQFGAGELSEDILASRREEYPEVSGRHHLFDDYWQERRPNLAAIDVPFLTAANWTSPQLCLREHIDLFWQAGSPHRHLRIHSGGHIEPFYDPANVALQRRFLDHWLKDKEASPPVPRLEILVRRGPQDMTWRTEDQFPLGMTQWQTFHLDASTGALLASAPADAAEVTVANAADPMMTEILGEAGTTSRDSNHITPEFAAKFVEQARQVVKGRAEWQAYFETPPFDIDVEVTGPIVLEATVKATAGDADIFVAVRDIGPDGNETVYDGVDNPETPVALGWMRLSHREEDKEATRTFWPVHRHDREVHLGEGEEAVFRTLVGPTSQVFRQGHRLRLEIATRDPAGSFPFLHVTPADRRTGGDLVILTGGGASGRLIIPTIPA